MAIREYKFNSREQLSTHFNVQEFRCKCGGSHNIKVDTNLIAMLEKLYSKLNCSKIIVSSGYRCLAHDCRVGGNGKGQHTIGKAADVCCYDKKGKPISTKVVSCVAQDLGFGGIANINKSYTHIHLDTRSNKKYYGNEVINYNTVTSDFYKYYGLTKEYVNSFCGVAVIGTVPTSLVKLGAKGEQVKWIQSQLNTKINAGLTVDGKFGNKTLAAVKEFQKAKKLSIDGIVGPITVKALK